MHEESLFIPGQTGQLECRIGRPDDWHAPQPIAICCHPHPLYGGTLTNKVVHILAKTFNELGCIAVRFNFRGVGKSEGKFADGIGEQEDLLAVVDWFRKQYPDSPVWLAGFSFGAYVALMAHEKIRPARLLLVAPAVDMYPAARAINVQTPDWMLVQSADDEVVSAQSVKDWQQQQDIQPRLLWFDEAGHFFHGQLTRLNERIKSVWS